MGRRHSEVESEEKMVPYQITGAASDYVKVAIDGREHTPQEISSKTLRKLKESAEAYLGHKVNKAVITVPAYYQRRAAPGHQGCRADRWDGGPADHQRADGGGPGVRAR